MHGGKPMRPRLPTEAGAASCGFGCAGDEPCFVEAGMRDAEAEGIVREWSLCGGRERRHLPAAGGLAEQDAGLMVALEIVDGLIAENDAREAAKAGGKT